VVALKDERGKGSGRSVTGFDIHAALAACSEHLLAFGGHKYAVGLNLTRDRLPGFSSALAEYADGFPEEVFEPTLHIDAVAPVEQIDDAFVDALEKFEPFGPDNAAPLFVSLGAEVVGYPRKVGKNHLKLAVRAGERTLEAIAWGRSAEIVNLGGLSQGDCPRTVGQGPLGPTGTVPSARAPQNLIDICYTVARRTYAGRTSTQLTLRDLRTAEGRP
jgi:single-stranded-DNA-specific exonuclease